MTALSELLVRRFGPGRAPSTTAPTGITAASIEAADVAGQLSSTTEHIGDRARFGKMRSQALLDVIHDLFVQIPIFDVCQNQTAGRR